jgi:hypothetical protein
MTTTEVTICPICEQGIDLVKLSYLGLTYEQFEVLKKHVANRTIGQMITVAEIALRQMNPDMTNVEFQINEVLLKILNVLDDMYDKFQDNVGQLIESVLKVDGKEKTKLIGDIENKNGNVLTSITDKISNLEKLWQDNQRQYSEVTKILTEIIHKIGGTGIGNIGELITIRDLKQVSPMDYFDETRASKHGTDIIAKVNENGIICGTITVSVKYAQMWSSEFTEQITRNMKTDGSRFGILVTRTFPREALSEKAWILKTDEGNSVILVKPEYASLAYFGLREASRIWFHTKDQIKNRNEEDDEMEKTFIALLTWINGEEFDEISTHIHCAIAESEKTRDTMHQMQNYVRNKTEEAVKHQGNIIKYLTQSKKLLRKLRELLNSDSTYTNDNAICNKEDKYLKDKYSNLEEGEKYEF